MPLRNVHWCAPKMYKMWTVALSKTSIYWEKKFKCPSMGEQIKKLWDIHMMEYHSTHNNMDKSWKHKKYITICLHLHKPPKQIKPINATTYQNKLAHWKWAKWGCNSQRLATGSGYKGMCTLWKFFQLYSGNLCTFIYACFVSTKSLF